MIVTILPSGNGGFHAVQYNENKVSQGKAQLIEMSGFGNIGLFGDYTVAEVTNYLQFYTSRNDRIQKPQFHIAISCKGHELTEEELLDFAHAYLNEMGYGRKGQPILIYAHRDTDNTHLHVVTSRIGPDGKKINHNNERIRSQQAIDKILGTNMKQNSSDDIEIAKTYLFSNLTQFKAILSSLGYEAYEKEDMLYVKKGGQVQTKLPLAEIISLFQNRERDKYRERQLRAILTKYRDLTDNLVQLKKELHNKLGLDLVFFGKKDNPYGYAIVDHKNKTVHSGAQVMPIKQLMEFSSPLEKLAKISDYIDSLLNTDEKLTTKQINKKLRRTGAYVKGDNIFYRGMDTNTELSPKTAALINRNNRISAVESFCPTSNDEVEILCKIYGIDKEDRHLVKPSQTVKEESGEILETIREQFNKYSHKELRSQLRGFGIVIKRYNNRTFAIDFNGHNIIDLEKNGIDVSRLWKDSTIKPAKLPTGKSDIIPHGQNREWEVGSDNSLDKIDDHIDSGMRL